MLAIKTYLNLLLSTLEYSSLMRTLENKPFEGNSELYYVNESILEVNESGKSVSDPSLPIKEHNQIVRMSGYLTTTSNSRSRVSCR